MKHQLPTQFAFHDRVSKTPPQFLSFDNLIKNGIKSLTRTEKNNLFHTIQSNTGKGLYRLGGWQYNFKQFMKRFAVKYSYDSGFREIWAFDKTCIRTSFYTKDDIVEIIELKN
jgi:hypothetical protein